MEDQIIVTSYAPVFIPTLCRYEHFIKLLDSLEKCTWSEYTEVYVSLDYPPSEKYVEGHRQIDNYLKNKEEKNRFKQLHVFRQESNLGIGGNFLFLRHYINKYDRYIITEDDNVFSPNFLVFINKGLEAFKEDPSVIAINGYTLPYNYRFDGNTYFRFNNDFSAWGYGTWNDKMESIREDIQHGCFRKSFSLKNIVKVKKHGLIHLRRFICYAFSRHPQNIRLYDTVLSLYMIINDLNVICPQMSTVRNEGWDDTGNSVKYVKDNYTKDKYEYLSSRQINQKIDQKSEFVFKGDPMNYFDYNNHVAATESMDKITFKGFVVSLFSVFREYINKRGNK